MSCRVLGRQVEEAMLAELVRLAVRAGVTQIVGTYIPTDKNSMVAQHYPKLGFEPGGQQPDGTATYLLDVPAYRTPTLPHAVTRGTDAQEPVGA